MIFAIARKNNSNALKHNFVDKNAPVPYSRPWEWTNFAASQKQHRLQEVGSCCRFCVEPRLIEMAFFLDGGRLILQRLLKILIVELQPFILKVLPVSQGLSIMTLQFSKHK